MGFHLGEGSSFAEDDGREHLHQACPTGIEASVQAHVVDIWLCQDSWGAAMRQRTFHASAVAFVLGLVISLAWSLLHAYGL